MRHLYFLFYNLTFVVFLALLPMKSYGFKDLPVSSFENSAALAFRYANIDDENYNRMITDYYFFFAPAKKFHLLIEGAQADLNSKDKDFLSLAGSRNRPKKDYNRHTFGVRTLLFDKEETPVKVGIRGELSLNDTRDQNGESYGATSFVYLGHDLPLSLRYAYSVEFARRTTFRHDAPSSTLNRMYANHLYLRFDPYQSVSRVPVGYQLYYRKGNAPDRQYFDTSRTRAVEHSFFYYLPNNDAQIILRYRSIKSDSDIRQGLSGNRKTNAIAIGFEIPFQ